MSRIFISYKRVDKKRVFEIRQLIESQIGEECWIDLDGIESDAQFKNVIIHAINDCEVVLFMYSKAHTSIRDFERDWTFRELNFASSKKKRIVFVNIDGSPLTDEFYFDYGMKQQIDARSSNALNRLVKDLRRWLNIPKRKPAKPTNPTPPEDSQELFNKGYKYYTTEDYSNAIIFFHKAAEQGDANAQNWLGWMLQKGIGVAQDYSEAVKWYRRSAEQGYAVAQYNLGVMYDTGQGVKQDYAEAVKWYRKAAEQGDAYAQINLGMCYYNGTGVEQDHAEAKKWLELAAQKGNEKAKENLNTLFK